MADTGDTNLPDPQLTKHHPRLWARSIGTVKRKFQERRAKIKYESVAARATRRTTNATIWMAIFTVVLAVVSFSTLLVLRKQLVEMQLGGVDTKKLATAADNQANWTQSLATSAGTQAGDTHDLAVAAKAQSDQTEVIAKQAKVSADAAKSAAETAASNLLVSERPWISTQISVVGPLTFDQNGARILVSISPINEGHSAAVRVAHEINVVATSVFDTPSPKKLRDDLCSQEIHDSQSPPPGHTLKTWFPGDVPPELRSELVQSSDIKKAAYDSPLSLFPDMHPNGDFQIKIVYCVAYLSSFNKVQYHTGYVFDLERRSDDPPFENTLFNPKDGTVSLDKLLLRYDFIAGNGPDAN